MALFYCHKEANSGLSHHRKAISNKNVQNRPESEQFREMLGVFYFQKQIRKPGAGKEVMQMPRMPKISQERMGVLSWRLRTEEIITSYAESAKGAASRASVPLLSYAHNTNRKGACSGVYFFNLAD